MKFLKNWEPLKKYGALVLVVLVGLVMIIWPRGADPPEEAIQAALLQERGDEFDLAAMEARLQEALSNISGAGKVEVLLTLRSDMEVSVVQDTETRNRSGGIGLPDSMDEEVRVRTVLAGGAPIVERRIFPEFLGALIVTDGASDARVHNDILNAVASLTGLGANAVSVVQRRSD